MQIEHKKNTAYYLSFPMVDSSTPASFKSGVSPADTAYYKDGAGAWTSLAITDTASEIGATGVYEIDLTAAELNHDQVIIKFSVAGAADTAFLLDMRAKLVDDLNDITAVNVRTEMDSNSTQLAAIVADTNELQTDWADGGRLDLILDARSSQTSVDTIDGNVDAILLDTGTDGVVISATTANQIADALLNRDFSAISDTNARTLLNAARFLRNKYSVSGTTLTVTKEDDTTSAWTSTLTTDATADPVTGSDPA